MRIAGNNIWETSHVLSGNPDMSHGDSAQDAKNARPKRPAIPPVLLAGLLFWVACAGVYGCSLEHHDEVIAASNIVIALGAAISLFCVARGRWIGAVLSVMALAGLFCGMNCANTRIQDMDAWESAPGFIATVQIESDASTSAFSTTWAARIIASSEGEQWNGRQVLIKSTEDQGFSYGDYLHAKITPGNLSQYDRDRCWKNGQIGTAALSDLQESSKMSWLWPLYAFRQGVCDAFESSMANTDASGVLRAMICGDRRGIEGSAIYDAYKSAGCAHMIAVSGAHLGIVCAMTMIVLRKFKASKKACWLFQVLFILAYVIFTALSPSSLRAAIMCFCAMSAFFTGRRASPLNAAGVCIIGVLVASPSLSLSVSFLLSALSTLAIGLFLPLFGLDRRSSAQRLLLETVGLSISSSLVTMPICASIFSEVSLIGVFTNMVVTPLFTLTCYIGFIGGMLHALPFVGPAIMQVSGLACWVLNSMMTIAADIPFSSISCSFELIAAFLATFTGGALLYAIWPATTALGSLLLYGALLSAFVLIMRISVAVSPNALFMLDVGQGDCFALRSGGVTAMIDTGNKESLLKQALAQINIQECQLLFITHPDSDHCDCIETLSRMTRVEQIVVSAGVQTCTCENCTLLKTAANATGSKLIYAQCGDTWQLGAYRLTVIWPNQFSDEGGNNDSLCLLLEADINEDGTAEYTGLFVGDAEAEIIERFSSTLRGRRLDIYKVSHHGSKTGLSDQLASWLHPRIALISAGESNRYGHPHAEVLEWLQSAGSLVYQTSIDGTVELDLGAEGIAIVRR